MDYRKTARRTLRKHIDASHGGCLQKFASLHGFSRPIVSLWLSGRRTPGHLNALRLEQIVGIPAREWFDAKQRRTLSKSSAS